MMENIIAAVILLALVGGAAGYLIKAKKNGVKCVGCPAGGSCSAARKTKQKKLEGPVIQKKTMIISGMHCAHCVQNVTESLNRIDGVTAKVDLSGGCALLSLDRVVEDRILIQAVEQNGFKVESVQCIAV